MAIIIGKGQAISFPEGNASFRSEGFYGKRYVGYFQDDVNFFNTAPLHGDTSLTTSIDNFSSNSEYYSWMWIGIFKAPTSGTYNFYTNSDDASYLWLGNDAITGYTTGNALVNNGGYHGGSEVSGSISLIGGKIYPIRIMFGQGWGGDFITVSFEGPGITKTTDGSGFYFGGAFW